VLPERTLRYGPAMSDPDGYFGERVARRSGVTIGDFATTRVDGTFSVAYLVYNTIMNLTTQAAQVACFGNARGPAGTRRVLRHRGRGAKLAGLRLRKRWDGWTGEPFTSESRQHVSIWEKPAG
jgi:hypothetical protein